MRFSPTRDISLKWRARCARLIVTLVPGGHQAILWYGLDELLLEPDGAGGLGQGGTGEGSHGGCAAAHGRAGVQGGPGA